MLLGCEEWMFVYKFLHKEDSTQLAFPAPTPLQPVSHRAFKTNTYSFQMRAEKYLWQYGRAKHTAKTSFLPLPTRWSHTKVCPTGFRVESDYKSHTGLHLCCSCTPDHPMESRYLKSCCITKLCRCHLAALDNCFGFIDGNVRPISRPGECQHVGYNGHKCVHPLKFQLLAQPNGLIESLYEPAGTFLLGKAFSYMYFD